MNRRGWAGSAEPRGWPKELPECPAHGYLLFLTGVEGSLQSGRPAEAGPAARQLQELGQRLDQPWLADAMNSLDCLVEGREFLAAVREPGTGEGS